MLFRTLADIIILFMMCMQREWDIPLSLIAKRLIFAPCVKIERVMIMQKVCDVVAQLAEPVAQALSLSIWDVEYVKEGGQFYLRIYIDREGGVTIDDCEVFSRAMDPILDREDPVPDSYIFEVCSAGMERTLKRPKDFLAYIGHTVEIRTFAPRGGTREFVGTLAGYENGTVSLSIDGRTEEFTKKDIARARRRIEF